MNNFFKLDELNTTIKTEAIAGITTFMTMSYILVINPQFLSTTGMSFDGVLFATAISSAIATLVMGLWARYPIALAPGMGLNAYFSFVVVPQLAKTLGDPTQAWKAALAAVLFSGILFLILSFFKVREHIIDSVPHSLKLGISAGIGLFIALIGFKNGFLIQASKATFITLGDILSPSALLSLLGLILLAVLMVRKIKASALITIFFITILSILFGQSQMPETWFALPKPGATFFALDIMAAFRAGIIHIIFAFFFVDLFDTIGTLIGVAEQGKFINEDGKLPRASAALLSDAIGTILGALLGTSTVTSYIESISGISVGGRSGLASVFTALCFLISIFLAPLLKIIPPTATAPVLIVVGALMMKSVKAINWEDLSEGLPAFLTLAGIAFTYSIADGMALGFISYALVKSLSGQYKAVSLTSWLLAIAFIARYLFLR